MQTAATYERVATMPPGPELAATLATLVLAEVPSDQVVEVLRAQARQLAHEQARLLAAMVEVSRTTPCPGPDPRRADEPYPWASGEIAAALTLTARSADRELSFAETLMRGLPLVFAELLAGRLDRAKAWVFADYLAPGSCALAPAQIQAICARLVGPAAGWTTGQLAARLLRAIIAIDPDQARRRYDEAIRERGVSAYLDHAGTVTITASGLPADEAAAACERLERLAAAAKRAGHPAALAQIQADLFLGLLDGRYHHHTQAQIIADLLHRAGAATSSARAPEAPSPAPATPSPGTSAQGEPRAGIEIRVGLTTLLGLDDRPGEIPGLGPVGAQVARAAVTNQCRGAQWRFAVTDPDGYLLLAGAIHRRPRLGIGASTDGCLGGVVEIHVSAAELRSLTAGCSTPSAWAGVVADIAAQYARRDALAEAVERHPAGRYARAALARHVQVRDRTCSHPGCRRPARKSDLDHTREHARGGATSAANIGPCCPRHHLYKHEMGWRLRQPAPGRFEWTSPLGTIYRTRGEAISPPLPDPMILRLSPPVQPGEASALPPRETSPRPPPTVPLDDEPPY